MTAFKTGVHTIEFQTTSPLITAKLPGNYRNAIRIEGGNKYRLNVAKIPCVPEYGNPSDTQAAIEEAFAVFSDIGAGHCKTTRIDYRLDDHDGTYADNLPLMTVLINLIAYIGGIYDRRVFYSDGNDIKTSVRCMPESKDHSARYGVEYYDKLKEEGNAKRGNARLEFRRLNMNGETVQCAVREWRDLLQSITKKEYLAMLEEHARSLHALRQDGETATEFVKRVRRKMIAYEEQTKLYRISGKAKNHYYEGLPRWEQVREFIGGIIAQLDEALAQPLTVSSTTKTVMDELPF